MTATGSAFRCSGTRWPAARRRPTTRMAPESAICSQPSGRGSMTAGHYHRPGERCPPPARTRWSLFGGAGPQLHRQPARELVVLSQDAVRRLLDLDRLGEALAAAFVELRDGRAPVPPRGAART